MVDRQIIRQTRHTVACAGVGFASLLGLLGLFISFVPGAELEWWIVAAAMAAIGILSPNFRLRLVAVTLVVAFAWFSWLGYQHGLRYQEWLRNKQQPSDRQSAK